MKTLKFTNGDTMHAIGLGTWKSTGADVKKAVKDALHAGYRHIDTAAAYGNEEVIGEALSEIFAEGKIFREDVFITSKLWNDSHAEGQVIPALQDSLKKLQLDYLDLYLIHWPVAFRNGVDFPKKPEDYLTPEEAPIIETWKQMEKAKKDGLAKHIGVSNFSDVKLKELIVKASVKPEMNQVELHPLLQQDDLLAYCKSENVLVTAYSPLGSGDRSDSMKGENEPNLLEIDTIKDIAKKHNASAGQILISWHNHRGNAAIPKSTSKEHIKENFKAASIELDETDMKAIAKLDEHYRFITGKFFEEPSKGYKDIYDENSPIVEGVKKGIQKVKNLF
ncbi:aldo/keto reductase [Aequorivita vladivostokensis]|uniref:aldo/keto reductase n=1 Tax=Aequorivita vladivostokensis TaxID=171194 RepID=UPI0005D364C3|nr:aldo/keto reductase [Aequorivita vladivostokensis]MAB56219.1 aldo/keto reductase [Aequorivita sp.]MBF30210.1 aldo/keto reductase [Aequorivita sp.]|tara:strand:+ start:328807 stop:329811 length:1005 start_codon:yes stop_codon:yes gene_type:complete